jgi:hypothetical protein
MINNNQRGNKMLKRIEAIKNQKGIFTAEKINRIARYISNRTGLDMRIATLDAKILMMAK